MCDWVQTTKNKKLDSERYLFLGHNKPLIFRAGVVFSFAFTIPEGLNHAFGHLEP